MKRAAWAALVASTAAATALTTTAAHAANAPKPRPAQKAPIAAQHVPHSFRAKLSGGLKRLPAGRQAVFVQLAGQSAANTARMGPSGVTNSATVRGVRAEVARQAGGVLAAARGADRNARQLFTVSNAIRGVGLTLDSAAIQAVAKNNQVVKVSRIVPKSLSNANTAQLVRAVNTWHYANGLGRGVKIGVIDTGLDYTHADFGGVGTKAAYDAALADDTNPGWYAALPALAKAKIIGGYDFAGDNYNADPTSPNYQPVPNPDQNPLDCNEHGTHVSGTAAGYGVTAGGHTFTGQYPNLTKSILLGMKVGPGMAPKAGLYPLRVFGCSGSTDLVIPALDKALDPNGDGNFADHLNIVNMSLGSDYSPVDDPENAVVDNLSAHGVLSVIAMGNNGDLTDTGGAPGNAVSSLAVASSVDSYQLRDGIKVNRPASVAGVTAGQMSVAYDWPNNGPTHQPVTGDVAAIPGADPNNPATNNGDGCDPLTPAQAAAVKGKVAWLEWDDNDATRRCGSATRSGNVKAAGAIGAILTSHLDVFGAGITGDPDIPVFQLPKAGTDKLRPALNAGTLNVTFDGKYQATIKDINPAISDTLSSFSSRGPHGSIGVVKPDVTAPGDTIASAGMGTGNNVLVISGTSMATPLAAGVAALVKGRHPSWNPLLLKSAVMNTAGNDLWTGPNKTGHRYAPARVGAGRVDALRAATTTALAYVDQANNGVSASFGVVPAPINQAKVTRSLKVTVLNKGTTSKSFKLSYDSVNSSPGVAYTVSPSTLTVGAGGTGTATVTMTVTPSALRHTIDPTMDTTQIGLPRQFVSDSSGHLRVVPAGQNAALRVPVYGAAKPVSLTTATATKPVGTTPGHIDLHGSGVSNGGAPGSDPTAYNSLVSVMQLGQTSGQLPICTGSQTTGCTSKPSERAGDIHYIGAGTDTSGNAANGMLYFGMSTYGDWPTVGNTLIPYVDFDTNGDGKPDYETYVQNYPSSDVLLANTVDLATGNVVDQEPVNFEFGNVDTNVFDNNVVVMPVALSAVNLPTNGTSAPIRYKAGTYNANTGSDIDDVGPVSYNAGKPAFQTPGALFYDQGNTSIDYTVRGNKSVSALVLHLHGAYGNRAEVVSVN